MTRDLQSIISKAFNSVDVALGGVLAGCNCVTTQCFGVSFIYSEMQFCSDEIAKPELYFCNWELLFCQPALPSVFRTCFIHCYTGTPLGGVQDCRSDRKLQINQTIDALLAHVSWLLQAVVYTHSSVLSYGSNTIIINFLESNKWET